MKPNNLIQLSRSAGRPDLRHRRTLGCHRETTSYLLSVLGLLLFLCLEAHAQFPGGFGGFPGTGANTGSRSRSTGTYPNNGVGDATFHVDPDTRSLIVIADQDTTKYISEVLSNLDRPKPQVLIK